MTPEEEQTLWEQWGDDLTRKLAAAFERMWEEMGGGDDGDAA